MKFNFKKVSAVFGAALMTLASAGFAAAAQFPAPFVHNGVANNVAIVYGSNAQLDVTPATSIETALNSHVTGGSTTITGEAVSLGTSSQHIWLNSSLASAKSTLTKSDLPTVLADSTFNGDQSATLYQTIALGSGSSAGNDNSGRVIFTRQPSSSNDPVVGISMGTTDTNALYNESVSFSQPINFTSTESQGQVLHLFGKDFTVSSSSSSTAGLVLYKSAQTVTLTQGGTSAAGSETSTVTIDGTSHTITLLNAGSSSATISVDGSSQSVNVGSSRKINGVNIAVTSVQSSTAGGNTATVLVGAQTLTFKDGQTVMEGDNNQAIQGTHVYLTGGITGMTKLTVGVYAPDTLHDAILKNQSFTDPVFGTVQVNFAGLSTPLNSASRGTVNVSNSGDSIMMLSMTDSQGNQKAFEFANNESGSYSLSTSGQYNIYPYEMANLSLNDYTLVGNGNYGHLIQVQGISNTSSQSTGSGDSVTLTDAITGSNIPVTITSKGTGNFYLDGRQYTVTYGGTGQNAYAQIKYPTSDSANANTFVLYPTIQTKNGAEVALYEPLTFDLSKFDGTNAANTLEIPNGDQNAYTSVSVTTNATGSFIGGTQVDGSTSNSVTKTVGQLTYKFAGNGTAKYTTISLVQPGASSTLAQPGVVEFEGKDNNNNYNAVVIETQDPSANSDKVGVSGVYFTSAQYQSGAKTLQSNNKLTDYVDWYGTLVQTDSSVSSQETATISNPSEQTYANVYLGEAGANVTSGSSLGNVIMKDTDSGWKNMNVIIVGGTCINSAAAQALDVPLGTCGPAFTAKTGVGANQFMIKGLMGKFSSGKLALVVAGYDAQDTVNAATYLTKKMPDTSSSGVYSSSTDVASIQKVA